MTSDDLIKLIGGIFATILTAAIIGLAKWVRGVDKDLTLRVSKIEWQLSAMATDASKALRNPHAATERMKTLLAKFEDTKLDWDELKELTEILEDARKDETTSRADKGLISTVLREIERRYSL